MISNMDKERSSGRMGPSLKESLSKERNTVKENTNGLTGVTIKANGSIM